MTVALTVNLLVIVFLGGSHPARVLVGAVLFTALPNSYDWRRRGAS